MDRQISMNSVLDGSMENGTENIHEDTSETISGSWVMLLETTYINGLVHWRTRHRGSGLVKMAK